MVDEVGHDVVERAEGVPDRQRAAFAAAVRGEAPVGVTAEDSLHAVAKINARGCGR